MMNFNDEINIILKNSGIQLNENDSNEIPEDIDESLKEMIEIINEMESNGTENNMHALEELSERLYDCCRNYDRDYESAADRFEQKLFEDAMNDDSTAQYRTREMTDRYYEELCDDFYNSENDNIINLIDKYSNYSLGSIFSDIEDYCNKFFEEEQSEYIDEPQIDPTTIDDQTTIDESFDPEKSENEDMKEIYNYVTTTDPHRAYNREVYDIFVKCMNCGYRELESYIQDLEDDLRSGYIDDSDNWGTEYDSDATYDYCSSMSMSEKIERYAGYDEINEFKDEVKDLIENEVDYSFSSDDEKEEFYDGSDDELDEAYDYLSDNIKGNLEKITNVGDIWKNKYNNELYTVVEIIDFESVYIDDNNNFHKYYEPLYVLRDSDDFNKRTCFKEILKRDYYFVGSSNKNYDGSEDELDESYLIENEVELDDIDDIEQQLKFFFNKVKKDLESLSDYQKQIEDLPRKIKFDCGALCFYIENLPEYNEYNKLKSIKDDFRREVFDTIDLENCEYAQYYDEDEELFDGDSTEAIISNLSDKAFIDEFATYYCVEKFCNDVEKEIQALDKMQYYDGSENELDESISPSWHYEVGDKVVEKDKDVVWVIRYIEKYDIGLRRYVYGGVMTTSCPKDQFEKKYELLKQRDSKYVYDGSEEELDESVNKELTPLDKLLKLHKKHPNMSITDIARKVTDDNIEEYISLMKQYYEKFEK